jgi:hypothetical protein
MGHISFWSIMMILLYSKQSKAVPIYAMVALGGEEV